MPALDFKVREAEPNDLNFIYSTWLDSFTEGSYFDISHKNYSFQNFYRNVIDFILAKADTKVFVACDQSSPEVIWAYLVCEANSIVHYAFTKIQYQQLGILKRLITLRITGSVIYYTHKTRMGNRILTKHPEFQYQASLIFKGESNGPTAQI